MVVKVRSESDLGVATRELSPVLRIEKGFDGGLRAKVL
jgi:hypothetical protein